MKIPKKIGSTKLNLGLNLGGSKLGFDSIDSTSQLSLGLKNKVTFNDVGFSKSNGNGIKLNPIN